MFSLRIINALIFIFVSFLSEIGSQKSLFDELPLNGAFVPDETIYSVSSSKTSKNGHKVPQQETLWRGNSFSSHNPIKRQDHLVATEENDQAASRAPSLFDELPNQGALAPGKQNRNRNPRDSSVDFDVTRIKPSEEFDIPYWDNRLLTPIVNSISRPQRPLNPSIGFYFSNSNRPRGPPPNSNRITLYGPPPPPPKEQRFSQPPPKPQSYAFNYNKHHHHHHPPTQRMPQREDPNKSSHQVTATSGGPTVIVYAHPRKEISPGSSSFSSNQPPGSWSAPESTTASAKNEIHYHYHINQNKEEGSSTTAKSLDVEPSSEGYAYPAPSSYYRPQPSPPSIRNNKPRGSHPLPPNPMRREQSHNDPDFKRDPFQEEDDFNRRTFFTPSNKRLADSISFTKQPSTSYEIPPSFNAPSSSYNNKDNSQAYGPPNSNTPAPPQLDTSYGPPNSAPAPPSQDQQLGSNQYETTITLQTIPVTRTVTELVQVPNVVHKVSSNRPIQSEISDQASQDDSYVPPPSSAYGVPQRQNQQNIPQSPNKQNNRIREGLESRPFESHLEQILGVGPTQNSKDAVLQELLLSQARNPGYDLTLTDLELLQLLQNSRGGGGGGGIIGNGILGSNGLGGYPAGFQQAPILSPGRNLFGRFFGGSGGSRGFGGGLFQNQQRDNSFGSSDSLGGLRDAFREQRFQIALQDLRKQLREQNKDNVRERSGYRSLFTKGALLLSALTLLPSVVNPMASAAGMGSAAAASAIPNFMLPVTAAGRRKREIREEETPFEKCLQDIKKSHFNQLQLPYRKWVGCANNLTIEEIESIKSNKKDHDLFSKEVTFVPKMIGGELMKYISANDLMKESSCIQRDLCRNIVTLKSLPDKQSLVILYALLEGNIKSNPWIQESVNSAIQKQCGLFKCHQSL